MVWQVPHSEGTSVVVVGAQVPLVLAQATASCRISPVDGLRAGAVAMGPTKPLGRVRVWHLNDSLKPCGSRVDRHAGLGRGLMGLEPFRLVLNDSRFAHLPMILETPKGTDGDEDLDSINLRILRQLSEIAPAPDPARRRVKDHRD